MNSRFVKEGRCRGTAKAGNGRWSPAKRRGTPKTAEEGNNDLKPRGRLKRSARTVQLFGCLAAVETHTLWYFGHHCCLVVGSDILGIWHFWIFTLLHPFLPCCTTLFVCTFSPHQLFLYVDFSPPWGPREGRGDVANQPNCGPSSHASVWPFELGIWTPTVWCGRLSWGYGLLGFGVAHMYGLHLHSKTMMMRMLWVMMGMFVLFVAPSLTLKRCLCVTSVKCNIEWIALTHTHTPQCDMFLIPQLLNVVHTSCVLSICI